MSQRRPQSGVGPTGRYLAYMIPTTIRETRLAIGWTQRALAARADTSQATLSRVEAGQIDRTDLAVIGRVLDALQVRLEIRVDAPFLADRRRQREPAHAHCVAYVVRRLTAAGWVAEREVEVVHGRSHGWIDVLAYRPEDRALLVIEMKTEVEDLGQIERSIRWYVREGPAAAVRLGWHPRRSMGALIVLDTLATAERLRRNRDAIAQTFTVRADGLRALVTRERSFPTSPSHAIAAVDPLSRRREWLRPTVLDGRRSPAAYEDYADFMRKLGR